MRPEIVARLQKLNIDFYQQTASFFSESRSKPWPGWEKLWQKLEELEFTPKKILDVGCGNGRFVDFLQNKLESFEYLGIDSSEQLLKIALQTRKSDQVEFKQADIVTDSDQITEKFDLITAFGVYHHLPSRKARLEVTIKLLQKLSTNGVLVFTLWNFLEDANLAKRILPWTQINLDPDDLEENDYLLDWQRGIKSLRYVHYMDKAELENIVEIANAKKVYQFIEDGKNHLMNTYILLTNP